MKSKIVLSLILILAALAQAQNQILIVSSRPGDLGNTEELDKIIADLNYVAVYSDQLPLQLETYQYSLVILAEFEEFYCAILGDYMEKGGSVIVTGQLPFELFSKCANRSEMQALLGFDSYLNGSGDLKAAKDLDMIGLPKDSLLDRTPCEIGFGGLNGAGTNAMILAIWQCPGKSGQTSAVTMNSYGSGTVFYFSRLLSAVRVRMLLKWAIDRAIQYRWGDADNSGRINLTDAVFIVRMVFGGGITPSIPNACDANGDGFIDISDAVWLINYIFIAGSPPRAGRVN